MAAALRLPIGLLVAFSLLSGVAGTRDAVSASSECQGNKDQERCQALSADDEAVRGLSMLQIASRAKEDPPETLADWLASRVNPVRTELEIYVYPLAAQMLMNQTTTPTPEEGYPSPVPRSQFYSGAKILSVQLDPSKELIDLVSAGGHLGPDDEGALKLRENTPVELRITQLPDAQIGWSGPAGESDPVNIPHTLLTVRLPLDYKGELVYQSVYALVDDDVAMKTYRYGHGIPAKLSNLTLGPAFPSSLSASRRGFSVLEAPTISDAGVASDSEFSDVRDLMLTSEMNYGTEAAHVSSTGPESIYKLRDTKAIIHDIRKFEADLSIFDAEDGQAEGIAWMFSQPSGNFTGYLVEADLNVTTHLMSHAHNLGAPSRSTDMSTMMDNVEGMLGGRDKLNLGRRLGVIPDRPKSEMSVSHSYNNGEAVWFQTTLNETHAQKYLPPGATLAKGAPGTLLNVRWQPAAIFGPRNPFRMDYNEIWVMLPVVYKGKRYNYFSLMLLDEDIAAMVGADCGLPKKLANMTFTLPANKTAGSKVHLDINRRGRKVLAFDAKIGVPSNDTIVGVNDNQDTSGEVMWMVGHQYPWKPEFDRPWKLLTRPIFTTLEQTTLTDVKLGPLSSHPEEPLADWFVGDVLAAGYVKINCDFFPSKKSRVADYVEEPDPEAYSKWWQTSFPALYM